MIAQSVSAVFEQNIIGGRYTSPISKLPRRFNTFILTFLVHTFCPWERLNRTLNEAARAILIHANMPQQFWPEAVATTVYTWNHLLNLAINNKTPYELYYGEKPDLHHMWPFRCIVFAHVSKARQGKES